MDANPTGEPAVQAFCSYAKTDNQTLTGVIQHIIEDICLFYKDETGRSIKIFFELTDIGWGEDLRNAISDSVENATFLIPMITAPYFGSDDSREQLLSFYVKCQSLGVNELILPIVLAGLPHVSKDSNDEVVRIIASIHFEDWTEIWQYGRGSPEWNIGVTRLVKRLADFQQKAENHLAHAFIEPVREILQPAAGTTLVPAESQLADELGHEEDEVDLAEAEGAAVLEQVAQVVGELRRLLAGLGGEFDQIEVSDLRRLRVVLAGIGARYADQGNEVVRHARDALLELIDYDAQVRAMIRPSRQLLTEDQMRSLSGQVTTIRDSARRLTDSIREVDDMSEVLRRYSDESVSLRRALSPARTGLQTIRDIARILNGWISIEI